MIDNARKEAERLKDEFIGSEHLLIAAVSEKTADLIDLFNKFSLDKETVRNWWQRWPEANVGILTGQNSGISVLDIDLKHEGFSSL